MIHIVKIVIAIFVFTGAIISQTVTGYIRDTNKQPLEGANIIVQNSTIGTASNSAGIYLLKLKEGNYQVIFRYLGYRPDTVSVDIKRGETIENNVILQPEEILQKTIVVYASRVNVAEQIILNVIENKDEYLAALKNYTYNAYQKTLLEIEIKDSLKIGGILETISAAYYEAPDNFQEKILAKKQTKNFSEANNIFTMGKIPNVLEEHILVDELAVVSPLNTNALDYYSYNMIDTITWKDKTIFNIGITPKTENIPLFSGNIKITNDDFTIAGLYLEGGEIIKSALKKDFILTEEFREYNSYFWLPVNVRMKYKMDLGIPAFPDIYFDQQSILSDYQINTDDFEYKFDNNLVTISLAEKEQAEKLWGEFQTIPLTDRETKAVNHIDSIITNGNIFQRGLIALSKFMSATDSTIFTSFSDYYHFNKVEGNYLGVGLNSINYLKPFYLSINGGYGFADRKYKINVEADYHFLNKHKLFVRYHDWLNCIDRFSPYSYLDVTVQAVLNKNDYNDYFYEQGWETGVEFSLTNILKSAFAFSTNKNSSAVVNSNWSLFSKDKEYRESIKISEGRTNELSLSFTIDSRKFYNFGWVKIPVVSQYYTFAKFDFIHSSKKILGSDYAYNIYHLFSNQYLPINNYLNLNLAFAGGIVTGDNVLQNYFYLPGFYYTVNDPITFRTVTSKNYLGNMYGAVFWENNFKNFLFNLLNVPFLQNSKYDLYVFANYAYVKNESSLLDDYSFIVNGENSLWEVGWGIGNILGFMKCDFAWGINKKPYQHSFSFQFISNLQL